MDAMTDTRIEPLSPDAAEREIGALAELLHACVHAGASVNFVMPFPVAEAEAFWRKKVLPSLHAGSRILLIARVGDSLAGTVQLSTDTPPNQPHRAEVSKLLVHPGFRRRGLARALMAELERRASALGKSLITLDTRTGDMAEPLYASMGYLTAGTIPGYCLDPFEDRLDATTIMYKQLA
jgi:ribosomal protein S18 acetylase RimI-like enzyme